MNGSLEQRNQECVLIVKALIGILQEGKLKEENND